MLKLYFLIFLSVSILSAGGWDEFDKIVKERMQQRKLQEAQEQEERFNGTHSDRYDIDQIKKNTDKIIQEIDKGIGNILEYSFFESKIISSKYALNAQATVQIQLNTKIALPNSLLLNDFTNDGFSYHFNELRKDIFSQMIIQHIKQKNDSYGTMKIGFDYLDGKASKYYKELKFLKSSTNDYNYIDITFQRKSDKLSFNILAPDLKKLKPLPTVIINNKKFVTKSSEFQTLYEVVNAKRLRTFQYIRTLDETFFNNLNNYIKCNYGKEVVKNEINGIVNISIPYTCEVSSELKNAFAFDRDEIDGSYVRKYFIRSNQNIYSDIFIPEYHVDIKHSLFHLCKFGDYCYSSDDRNFIANSLGEVRGEVEFSIPYNQLADLQNVSYKIHGTTKTDKMIESLDMLTEEEKNLLTKQIIGAHSYALSIMNVPNAFQHAIDFEQCAKKYIKGKSFNNEIQLKNALSQECKF